MPGNVVGHIVNDILGSACEPLPGTHIHFSSILLRLFYGCNCDMQSQSALNGEDDQQICQMTNSLHALCIVYDKQLQCQTAQSYHRDGIHLSDEGSEYLSGISKPWSAWGRMHLYMSQYTNTLEEHVKIRIGIAPVLIAIKNSLELRLNIP